MLNPVKNPGKRSAVSMSPHYFVVGSQLTKPIRRIISVLGPKWKLEFWIDMFSFDLVP